MKAARWSLVLMLLAGLLMTGCASTRLVDSDVTAFSSWTSAPPLPGTPYRFERLPSQQAPSPVRDRIEWLTQSALAKVGMVLQPDSNRFSVQVVNSQRVERFADDGFVLGGPAFIGSGLYGGYGGYGGFGAYGAFPFPRFGELYYQREVSLLVRDLASNQVVFETRAHHDGPWNDTLGVLPAMLDAALIGFPQPAPGTRRVDIQIPR